MLELTKIILKIIENFFSLLKLFVEHRKKIFKNVATQTILIITFFSFIGVFSYYIPKIKKIIMKNKIDEIIKTGENEYYIDFKSQDGELISYVLEFDESFSRNEELKRLTNLFLKENKYNYALFCITNINGTFQRNETIKTFFNKMILLNEHNYATKAAKMSESSFDRKEMLKILIETYPKE